MAKKDIKFYLTASEPNISQPYPSQSIGGYCSITEYSVNALLADNMNTYTETMILDDQIDSGDAILTNSELMKISETENSEYGDEIITVSREDFGTNSKVHVEGDIAYIQNKNSLLNSSFDENGKQYRCIAIKNTSNTDTLYNVTIYIKSNSKNSNSKVKIALEIPSNDLINSTSTSGTSISVIDESLIGNYDDDFFVGRLFVVTDSDSLNYNIAQRISSFDSRTGTITFADSFVYDVESNISYRIEQPASQRIISGRSTPSFNTEYVSELIDSVGIESGISLNFSGNRTNENNLLPNELMYIWFERDVSNNTDKYIDNSFIFTINYEES